MRLLRLFISGLLLASGLVCARGEERAWAELRPTIVKAPIAVELKRNPLHQGAPLRLESVPRALQPEDGASQFSAWLSGRLRGVLRSGDQRSIMLGGRLLYPGQDMPPCDGLPQGRGQTRVRLKSIETDRLVFLVSKNSDTDLVLVEWVHYLPALMRAR